MDAHDIAGLLSEILTLVGLLGGGGLYLAGLAVRDLRGRWVRTEGVIAGAGPGPVIRWFDRTGEVHESPATTQETAILEPGDDVPVWFRARSPWRCRTHAPDHDGKALRLTGLVLLGVGIAAAVLGFVLLFV
ncbi:sortase [Cryobacterium sp. Sr8]|uniref:DUF3592 domain-containing protein n=1 Tax=unclassified Cryobacterium TaxID=2649013 RepID=UPI00106CD57C|nr:MULTISPECIES: DUF3592 domain-containing protein [unclassified Cryobacterium]TFD42005.1 sortase [Cryobacterium sp. TMT1-2-1]TFD76396.1 sortase [Cryobacterium sp. Sr8]